MDRAQRQRIIQRVIQEGEVGTQREFGSAAAVSRQIDTLSHADVLGTIAGDETLPHGRRVRHHGALVQTAPRSTVRGVAPPARPL